MPKFTTQSACETGVSVLTVITGEINSITTDGSCFSCLEKGKSTRINRLNDNTGLDSHLHCMNTSEPITDSLLLKQGHRHALKY